MTVRRLVFITLASLVLLVAALAANARSSSGAAAASSPADSATAFVQDLSEAFPDPPAAVEAEATAVANAAEAAVTDAAPSPDSADAASLTPTPVSVAPDALVQAPAVVDALGGNAETAGAGGQVEPPTLVEIPADLIATPTPDTPERVPLPMLTNIPSTPRDGSVVYLTFDDGPDPVYTNQILDVLARYGAKATFFVIGNSVDAYPGVVQRIVAEGHTVGNHTYYHEALPLEEPAYITQTLEATNGALARAVGRTSMCLRPPYGAMDQPTYDHVTSLGFHLHMWEVDSEDWRTNDSYAIASSVLATTGLGDRVLFHDGPSNRAATVAALDSVLQVLTTRGVQFHALSC